MLTNRDFIKLSIRKIVRQWVSLKWWILVMMYIPTVYFFAAGKISDVIFAGLIGTQFIAALSAHVIIDKKFTEEEKGDNDGRV